MICSCGFPGKVYLWTCDLEIYKKKSHSLHDPVNGMCSLVWAPMSRDFLTMGQSKRIPSPQTTLWFGQSSSFSKPSIGRPESPLLQVENIKTLFIKPSPQGSQRKRTTSFLPLLIIWTSQKRGYYPFHYTNKQHTKRGLVLSTCEIATRIIPA